MSSPYITEEDLNDPQFKKLVLKSMNDLLNVGAIVKRCQDSGWQDGSSWDTNEAAVYELKKAYTMLKKAKPSIDVKVYVDSTDHRSGEDYVNCECAGAGYLSVDEPAKPAKCVCKDSSK